MDSNAIAGLVIGYGIAVTAIITAFGLASLLVPVVEWARDKYVLWRLKRNYKKLYWFLDEWRK